MSWVVFALLSWLFIGLDLGFSSALQVGQTTMAPSFIVILLVFISMWATTGQSLTAAAILGLAADLVYMVPFSGDDDVVIFGPHALGFMLAAYTVRTMRALMYRRGALATGFLALVAALIAEIVVTSVLSVRSFYDGVLVGSATTRLFEGVGSAVLTGLVGVPVGWLLSPFRGVMGFPATGKSAFRLH